MTGTTTAAASLSVRLITYNIRWAVTQPVKGEKPWSIRRPKLCAQLQFIASAHPSAFICLQEVTYPQLEDIQASLGPSWNHIGRGRDDGKKGGEFSPIFFQPSHWTLARSQTYWLSSTPSTPSVGWDAALPRVVTVGSFRHTHSSSGTETPGLVVMSTHLDHHGPIARQQSAHLLLQLAKSWAQDEKAPVFLGGDFNSTPDSTVYETLTAAGSGMRDIAGLVQESSRYGNPEVTYTTFGEAGETPGRLDYLFVRDKDSRVRFRMYGILPNRFDDGVFLSDHRPVVADVEIAI
ncbi:Endonuclease/exonuclease/phosphatase [Cercophora newfieldiana]|uniref:Endonuclease/exonuclease/phosphatase n=1 Tax=Cercophora newfieldiana TaxID=92897 RepID=A0AA39YFL1_9PEZI|nr:Endonuclease/exonuclease/phosphatase [Cercophora newfieldiana]